MVKKRLLKYLPNFPKYKMVTNPQVRSNSSYCLVNGKQYYQGESFGSTCNRCTCYLYGAVYVDCVKASDCKERGTYDTEKGDTQTSNPAIGLEVCVLGTCCTYNCMYITACKSRNHNVVILQRIVVR